MQHSSFYTRCSQGTRASVCSNTLQLQQQCTRRIVLNQCVVADLELKLLTELQSVCCCCYCCCCCCYCCCCRCCYVHQIAQVMMTHYYSMKSTATAMSSRIRRGGHRCELLQHRRYSQLRQWCVFPQRLMKMKQWLHDPVQRRRWTTMASQTREIRLRDSKAPAPVR